jgi:Secretion system C-terminal sorting domain
MKKQLLLSSSMMVALFFSSHAQIINKANVTRKLTNADRKTMFKVAKSDAVSSETLNETFVDQINNNAGVSRSASVTTVLGVTKYDLQTNGAIGNRASRNADGTGHANYTFATDPQPSPLTRGTGYNYYNGTTWSAAPTARIEPFRTGWGDYAVLANGKELVVSHYSSGMALASRPVKGTGPWTTIKLDSNNGAGLTGVNFVWARMAASGQTVHIICNTKGTQTTNTAPVVNGVKSWLAYYRSTDGGVTFSKQAMPTLDSLNYRGGEIGGDNYSIDCKGDTVAVVVAASGHDVQLAKSTDGGLTWTKTVIVQVSAIIDGDVVPILPNGDTAIVIASDNSCNVLIDKNNKVHVFWGILRMTDQIPNDGSVNLFTSPSGIAHWTEGQPFGTADAGSIIADVKDLNGDTTINLVTRATLAKTVGRTGFAGLVSHPYSGYDGANNIYVSYDGLVEDTTYLDAGDPLNPNLERMMKHVYLIKGKVNPSNPNQWCFTNSDSALDIVDPTLFGNVEGIFACMSRRNNATDILVQWQEDNAAGTSLSNATAHPAPNNNGSATIQIKTDFIGLNSFGNSSVCEPLSIQNGGLKIEDLVRLYPNPSNGQLNLKVKPAAKNVSVEIVNLVGQSVYASKVAVGLNKINVTALNPGVYFANITVDGVKTSQKLVIE